MKLSAVYRSSKRANTYLYIQKRDDFSRVPDALLKQFGKPQFVTILSLGKHEQVAGIHRDEFIADIKNDGFYLQMPPKEKSWLLEHRESLGLDGNPPKKTF